ncbi:MAG: tRNA 2-thiouridine(34) synthase MnmA [bacterium]|nr:tRNA 2-thiouridine(34) synthase MnmA [bacterium]
MKTKTVAVGLSGGVDSSTAAYLLKNEGWNVIGITMKIWDGSYDIKETKKHACFGPGESEDIESASRICEKLDIPFHVIDLSREYSESILAYFKQEYLAGRTPNPCVKCNRQMKFGFMLEKARDLGVAFDYFATGHYAQIVKANDEYYLKKAADESKDQTYFIYGLPGKQLEQTLFPLGSLNKTEVREIARKAGFDTADQPDSQDFIAGGDYSPLFADTKIDPGNITDRDGNILGTHSGIINYTVGQRRGLGITAKEPMYVLSIDAESNRVIAGSKDLLLSTGLIAADITLTSHISANEPFRVKAKIRQRHTEADASIFLLDSINQNRAKIIFDEPQMSITPGQSVVFYVDDVVIGGGTIESAISG